MISRQLSASAQLSGPGRFPSAAIAAAALSLPEPPPEATLYEPITHRVAQLNPLLSSHALVFSVVKVMKYGHNGGRKTRYAAISVTHLLLLSESGAIIRAVHLSEVKGLTVDNSRMVCYMSPTVASGERHWLWEWLAAGVACTRFLGAFLQCRRALRPSAPCELLFEPVSTDAPDIRRSLKSSGHEKRIEHRRQQIINTTSQEIQSLLDIAMSDVEAEMMASKIYEESWRHHLYQELEQRREERLLASVLLAACVGATEALFRHKAAGLLSEITKLTVAGADLQLEIDSLRTEAGYAVQQRQSAIDVILDNAPSAQKRRAARAGSQIPEEGSLGRDTESSHAAAEYLKPLRVSYEASFYEEAVLPGAAGGGGGGAGGGALRHRGALQPSKRDSRRGVAGAKGLSRAPPGTRESVWAAQQEDRLIVSHPAWSQRARPADEELCAAFEKACPGLWVAHLSWWDGCHAELALQHAGQGRAPLPLAIAAAVNLGWVPVLDTGARLLVDTQGEEETGQAEAYGELLQGLGMGRAKSASPLSRGHDPLSSGPPTP